MANFPLLPEEGWLRDQEKVAKASLARADGVVFELHKILWNLITTPSAPHRRLRDILLKSRPPLEEEGKIAHSAFGQQTLTAGATLLRPSGPVLLKPIPLR